MILGSSNLQKGLFSNNLFMFFLMLGYPDLDRLRPYENIILSMKIQH